MDGVGERGRKRWRERKKDKHLEEKERKINQKILKLYRPDVLRLSL